MAKARKATKRSPVTGKFEWKPGRSVAIEVNTLVRMTEKWLDSVGSFLESASRHDVTFEWTKRRATELRAQYELLHPRR